MTGRRWDWRNAPARRHLLAARDALPWFAFVALVAVVLVRYLTGTP